MFNDYFWKSYLAGGGQETVRFFETQLSGRFTQEYADTICAFHRSYCPSKKINEIFHEDLTDLYKVITEGLSWYEGNPPTIEVGMRVLYEDFFEDDGISAREKFDRFSSSMEYFTTMFAMMWPEYFVPYYFRYNYNILEKIAEEFGIELPEIPQKREYKARFFHYGKICEAFRDFRARHGMSLYEFCAFLYDFAPKAVGGIDSYIIKDIPEPKGAYFIGGSKDDAYLTYDEGEIIVWQCSSETMPGDAVVMYLRSPVSAVDSVWRSVSIGFNDPFFYYYRCTYLSHGQKLKPISYQTLKEDPIFSQLWIVRKNMQGINGVEILPSVYNYLLETGESDAPRLTYGGGGDDVVVCNEKEVENKIIKPFLEALGYTDQDYRQQLYIEIGNHNYALIPDFVIHPKVSKGHQSADFLIEAKYSIASAKALEAAKTQARGYAKLLNAKYAVIASKEGIWVTEVGDDYTDDVLGASWSELKDEDRFHAVFRLLGAGK